ncbi:uncharacterized protein LOC129950772 [Eupeodes corollae]|uniref:uncharacterized protein LOC129950772 n=1 Tax=Eupeodes corollae TaxID=290404 RepID=UPI00248F67C2|nr:uncharacterized protein LOC129950772 [Eupeodes corollae]
MCMGGSSSSFSSDITGHNLPASSTTSVVVRVVRLRRSSQQQMPRRRRHDSITETPICNIAKNSAMAKTKILQVCKLIASNECTMAHKRSLEVLDRILKDLRDNQNIIGGAMILLSGDFRQTLPVISTFSDELNACLKSSNLWQYVKALQLTTNMRFLDIGNNKVAMDTSSAFITLPTDFCHITDSKEELIQRVAPDIAQKYNNHNWLGERAISAAKNKDVEDLNATIQNFLPGHLVSFKPL